VVHARTVGDATLTFIVSGKLWRNSLIMMDKETGSLWSHITGRCLEGEYEGTQLKMIPVVQTTWQDWKAQHPATRVLKKDEEIRSSTYEGYFADPEKTGIFRSNWLQERMPGKALVHGLNIGPHALAVADSALTPGAKVVATVGNIEVEVQRDADGGIRAIRKDTGEKVLVRTAFWFAWSSFFPRTEVVD